MKPPLRYLLRRASQIAEAGLAPHNNDKGLTPRQVDILSFVRDHEPCSQTTLVNHSGIDRSTLADIVERLCKKGLLSRKRNKDDKRAFKVTITTEGRAALKAGMALDAQAEKRFADVLRAPEFTQLRWLLSAAIREIEERDRALKKAA